MLYSGCGLLCVLAGWLRQRRDAGWLQQQLLLQGREQGVLFKGLWVCMGVATGVVAKGREVKNSAVYKTAQGKECSSALARSASWWLRSVGARAHLCRSIEACGTWVSSLQVCLHFLAMDQFHLK
jgi:hypothetical protein